MPAISLTAGLRTVPLTEPIFSGEIDADLRIEPYALKPYTDTFRIMVRDMRYDIAEMPVVTLVMAIDAGKPIIGLPVIMAGGANHFRSLLCRTDSALGSPASLAGKRIGVRAYAQTTGVWIRGILQHEYGIAPGDIEWIVTEDAHVEGTSDPAFVRHVEDQDLIGQLMRGELDAIMAAPHVVEGSEGIRPLLPNAQSDGQAWMRSNDVRFINHVICMKSRFDPSVNVPSRLMDAFNRSREQVNGAQPKPLPKFGKEANRRSIDLLLQYTFEQGLIGRLYRYDDIFAL